MYQANNPKYGYNIRIAVDSSIGVVIDRGIHKAGDKYGMPTLIERYQKKALCNKWRCICECGKETIADGVNAVKSGHISSCGGVFTLFLAVRGLPEKAEKNLIA